MTTKRWFLVATCLVCLFALPIIVIPQLPLRPGITRTNFGRISEGMSQAAVVGVFGEPPRDISPNGRDYTMFHNGLLQLNHSKEIWAGDDGCAVIIFDEGGRVHHHNWTDSSESWLQKTLRWFHMN